MNAVQFVEEKPTSKPFKKVLKRIFILAIVLLVLNAVRKSIFWYTWDNSYKLKSGKLVYFCRLTDSWFPFTLPDKSIADVSKEAMQGIQQQYSYPEINCRKFFLYSESKIYFNPIVGGNCMTMGGMVYSITDGAVKIIDVGERIPLSSRYWEN